MSSLGARRLAARGTIATEPSGSDQTLKSPAEFASIANKTERSRAIFGEIGKVATSAAYLKFLHHKRRIRFRNFK